MESNKTAPGDFFEQWRELCDKKISTQSKMEYLWCMIEESDVTLKDLRLAHDTIYDMLTKALNRSLVWYIFHQGFIDKLRRQLDDNTAEIGAEHRRRTDLLTEYNTLRFRNEGKQ